jgi:hypothetical protein
MAGVSSGQQCLLAAGAAWLGKPATAAELIRRARPWPRHRCPRTAKYSKSFDIM